MKKDDGGPAFPFKTERIFNDGVRTDTIDYSNPGMSLRDWFAGMVIDRFAFMASRKAAAAAAYEIADAMLEERKK